MSEINVTPLVDVMLVLLIIFMVTAPMLQQGLQVNLPETAASGIETNMDPLLLVISKSGQISIGSTPLPAAQLKNKISAIFKTRRNKQIYIQADKQVEYGIVAEAMADVRAAGVTNISLVTVPKNTP